MLALLDRLRAFRADSNAYNPITLMVTGILTIICLVVVFALFPTLTSSVATASGDANTSASTAAILDLLPLIFVAGLLVAVVAGLVVAVKHFKG